MEYCMQENDLVRKFARIILTKKQRNLIKKILKTKDRIQGLEKLSVVVPMYNVRDFLTESLSSIVKQDIPSKYIQVILIDDGSDDGTFEIAKNFTKQYPEIFELHQVFGYGAGKIRNLGMKLANGKYITFLDADDVIENDAYITAVKHIENTGSDILLGRVKRFNSKHSWLSEIHSKISSIEVADSITINAQPKLIYYTTAWDKVYNLAFLKNNDVLFSEGKIYEDIIFTNTAYSKAKAIDITDIPFYKWRSRDNGQKSDTQRTDDIQPLIDRYNALSDTFIRLKKEKASEVILNAFLRKTFSFDILVMFKRLQHIDLLNDIDKQVLYNETLRVLKNLEFSQKYYLANASSLIPLRALNDAQSKKAFFEVVKKYVRQEIFLSGEWINGKWTIKSNLSNVTKIATKDDFQINTKLQRVTIGEQYLDLEGFVYAELSDMSKLEYIQDMSVSLFDSNHHLLNENCGNVRFLKNKNITARYGYNRGHFLKDGSDFNYDYSSYKISIPIQKLIIDTKFINVQLSFSIDGHYVSTLIANPISGDTVRPKTYRIDSRQLAISIEYDSTNWLLQIKPVLNIAMLKYQDSHFIITNALKYIYLKKGKIKLQLKWTGEYVYFPDKVKQYLSQGRKNIRGKWHFITSQNGVSKPIYFDQDSIKLFDNQFFDSLSSSNGQAVLDIKWHYPQVTNVMVEENILKIDFELLGWEQEPIQVIILSDKKTPSIFWVAKKNSRNHYYIELPLTLNGFGEKEWLNFQVSMKFIDGHEEIRYLKWSDKHFPLEGTKISVNNLSWEFRRVTNNGEAFAIKRTADRVYREEIGSFARFLETEYQQYLSTPLLEDTIMWSAYWGRNNNFNGNPRALYEYVSKNYPKLKHIIVVQNVIHEFKGLNKQTKVISFGTKEYWYYLARSKYFVNDVNFNQIERKKRSNQIEIQTMHGTPLKTMGFDVLNEWSDATYNKLYKKFQSYDYLVVPSNWVGNYATHAFNIIPKLLKTGYPRNDNFFKKHNIEELNSIKIRLELPLDKTIVLYTPTYRIKNESVNLEQRFSDLDSLYRALGDNKILVIKNHNFDKYNIIPTNYNDRIFLMDPYEEISDLYMISDVLITDYSSVMFDYALLKKPMIFWAFDYEYYIKNRGINFDLRQEAPGPFVQNQSELEKWINDFSKIPYVFSQNIKNFNLKFGQYDNGSASQQISDIIWGEPK